MNLHPGERSDLATLAALTIVATLGFNHGLHSHQPLVALASAAVFGAVARAAAAADRRRKARGY